VSLQTIKVNIGSYTAASNGAGGKTETWPVTLTGLTCTENFQKSDNFEFRDGAAGQIERLRKMFVFDADLGDTMPAGLKRNDRILKADGTFWSVLNIRPYDGPMWQVDTEQGD
jgi:hypothetical protein